MSACCALSLHLHNCYSPVLLLLARCPVAGRHQCHTLKRCITISVYKGHKLGEYKAQSRAYKQTDGNVAASNTHLQLVVKLCYQTPLDAAWVVERVLPMFTRFCRDGSFHLRKVCAMELGELAAYFGRQPTTASLVERVFVPHLVALSRDDVWGVRKDAAKSFADVSAHVSMRCRRTVLAVHFDRLFTDISRWVIAQAYQSLGQFIATFADAERTGYRIVDDRVVYAQPAPTAE